MSSSTAIPFCREALIVTSLAINSRNADVATLVATQRSTLDKARDSGLAIEQPPAEGLFLLSKAAEDKAWLKHRDRLASEALPNEGPLTGYWVTVIWQEKQSGDPLSPKREAYAIHAHTEASAQPHREPFAFGSFYDLHIDHLRKETEAYWEAMDLRAAIASRNAPSPDRTPRL